MVNDNQYIFYDSDGRVIIITSDKGIGIGYVQSRVNMVK
jgi:hypothetical protein